MVVSQKKPAPANGDANDTVRVGSVALVILCQSTQALIYGGIALFLPLIQRDLGLSFTQAGTLAAASTIVYALMQIPSGHFADRVGAKPMFLIGLLGTNLLAFSFAHLDHYGMLLVNQALSGGFRSLLFAPGLMLMSALFPPERRATAMGLYVAGGFSSNVLLNTLGPSLVGPLGWRVLFMIFSAGGIIVLLSYWRFGASGPRGSRTDPLSLAEILRLFRSPLMWVIGAIQYVRLAIVSGLSFWLPTFLVLEKGYSLQTAGLLVALGSAVTAPANFLGGYVSDRLRSPLLVIGSSLTLLAFMNVLLVHITNLWLLAGVFIVNGIFVQFYFGPLFAVQIQMMGRQRAGLTTGCGNFFANLGSLSCAYCLGVLKDATGSFKVGLYSLAALCLLALVCTIALSRMKPIESA